MQKSVLLAITALVALASANSSNGNGISRRLIVGGENETKRNVQAVSTTYTTAQYCPSTKTYYYSKSFVCPATAAATTYSSA